MTQEEDKTTEETTVVSTEAPLEDPQRLHKNASKKPQRETSREEYVCSACGATVVPEEHETDRGIRYKCPKYGRFMKPLTQEDIREKEEEGRGHRPQPQVEGIEMSLWPQRFSSSSLTGGGA